jgi:hypothetical protein
MNTAYFDTLIDDFGIWEHSNGQAPNRGEGYALDDAARGLILCMLIKHPKTDVLFDYVGKSFRNGKLYGFAYTTHRFWGAPASEDATGQVIWAMGLAQHLGYRKDEATKYMAMAKELLGQPKYVRGSAYALLGAVYTNPYWAGELAEDIKLRFAKTTNTWPWPEVFLTYANGIVPYALLRYAKVAHDSEAAKLGLGVLQFVDRACRLNGHLGPIGNQGWHAGNSKRPPVYSQQPIDAAYMAWAMLAAHEITQHPAWIDNGAKDWMNWFEGHNITGKPIYDPTNNKCYDGIDDPARVSTNSGAESNLCWLLTLCAWEHRKLF